MQQTELTLDIATMVTLLQVLLSVVAILQMDVLPIATCAQLIVRLPTEISLVAITITTVVLVVSLPMREARIQALANLQEALTTAAIADQMWV